MNKKNTKKKSIFDLLDFVTDSICLLIKKVNKFLTDKKKSSIVKFIIRIICVFILIALLEIPFIIVGKIGEFILNLKDLTFSNFALDMWNFTIEYLYIIVVIIIFAKVMKDMSTKKDYAIEIKETKKPKEKTIYEVFDSVLKVLMSISLIPVYVFGVLLFAALGMLVSLFTHGIFIFGPLMIIIGLLVMVTFFLSFVYDSFNKGGNK